MNTRYNFITDYVDYADFRDYKTALSKMMIIDYADCTDYLDHLKTDTQLYVKNNVIIAYTDYVVMKGYY